MFSFSISKAEKFKKYVFKINFVSNSINLSEHSQNLLLEMAQHAFFP